MMFNFLWPWMIVLLPMPLLVRYLGRAWRRSAADDAPELLFPDAARIRAAFGAQDVSPPRGSRLPLLLLSLAWLGLVGALMQPQVTDRFTQVKNQGYDLMLAVDLSGSMRALDFSLDGERISRVDVIKSVVGKFVQERQGDRIGLILFGEHAYLQVPLTGDTQAIGAMLDNAQSGEAGDSTAIGDAIGVAVDNLRHRPGKDKVLVLLTDGADNASTIPPLQAAKLAAQYGIRIYTIGVGSNGPVPIPDENGQIVMAQMDLDEGLLKQIAAMTGGGYFRATDTEALQTIYSQINQLEKTEAEARSYQVSRPLYRYPLGAAMALLLLYGFATLIGRRHHDAV